MHIATKGSKIDISSEKRLEELANKILKKIKLGDVIFLYGEMGVGKTTFIKYLINSFQKKNKLKLTEITSPTFNLLNEYQINQIKINHYDLFRLKSIKELKNLDLFADSLNTITVIEWPQIINVKPKNLIELTFKYEDDYKKRSIQIKGLDLKSIE
jgi:tRNA threonylcarbamoyladenosine biosynthesis protein TsaE